MDSHLSNEERLRACAQLLRMLSLQDSENRPDDHEITVQYIYERMEAEIKEMRKLETRAS